MNFIYEKIRETLNHLQKHICIKKTLLDGFVYIECDYKKNNELPKVDSAWKELKKGDRWGGKKDGHYWFYKKVVTDEKRVWFSIKTGKEGQWDAINPQFIAYINGALTQGMDVNHTDVLLEGSNEYEIFLYAYCGMQEDLLEFVPSLNVIDQECERLYYDIKIPYDICGYLQPDEKNYIDILGHLEHAANLIDLRVVFSDEYHNSIRAALAYLKDEFYNEYCGDSDVTTVCIGHTHIDVAWLWTLAQTREKVLRSFSTVINLMKQYPEYKFMSSQAQLYKYLKEESPELYAQVKELVKQGRWEVEGAMWVEADCNLSSGESLVRQILFGKRFFKQEFDVDCKVLWLPDVFGYSAALPQILKKSGVDKFVTSKISWNENNQMPYDTFMWQGMDGTDILTYFLTAQDKFRDKKPVRYTTYVSTITASHVAGTWDRYQNKDLNNEILLTFGYGDGGGGPTKEMLEAGRRLEKGIKGCPKVQIDSATNFLERLERKVISHPKLPRWVGELYLELHRGTYTSIAKVKKNNRKSEFLYQTIELLSGMDMVLNKGSYPQQEINNGWEIILLNQFHDIIPGSSIKEVYEDSDKQFAEIMQKASEMSCEKVSNIVANIKTDGGIVVFNPHSFENSGLALVDGELIYAENIPPKGYKVVDTQPQQTNIKVCKNTIENKYFHVVFDTDGNITSIFDKANDREVIKSGQRANVLQAFEDFPKEYDAWEITNYYKDKMWEINSVFSIKVINEGIRAGLEIIKKFLDSTITQRIYLYNNIPRIDFGTKIDWKQEHILLKAVFPVDVHAEKATYDIQFGNVERSTHHNTSWDASKFEVCAHKFADVSEDGYGVSLLNDCKYGYDIFGSDIRITLLKSATYPNPEADKGEHHFVYSLYPHGGNFKEGKTVQMAYDLNDPMTGVKIGKQDGKLPDQYSLVECDAQNVIIETIKKAEDSDDLIFRLFECYNRRCKANITFGFDVKKAYLTDMMENTLREVNIENDSISIVVKPFEIITLKIVR